MGFLDFRNPGSGAPARQGLQKAGELIKNAFRPGANLTNPVSPLPPRFPWGFYNTGLFVTTFWKGIQGGDLTKADLDSVQEFLGYAPKAPVLIEEQVNQPWYGGQQAISYRVRYQRRNSVGVWQAEQNTTATNTGPFIDLYLTFGGPGVMEQTYAAGLVRSATAVRPNSTTVSFNMVGDWGHRVLGFVPATGDPDPEDQPPPLTPPTIAPPAPDNFLPTEPISPSNPAPSPAIAPSKKPGQDKKVAPPPSLNPGSAPAPYPDLNPTNNPAPGVNPDTNLTPGQLAPTINPASNPGKTTSFIPGATPPPALKPLPPGTTRTTRFLPPLSQDRIVIREPYTTPVQQKKPLPIPLPIPIPLPPIPAKLDCKELLDCLGGIIDNEPETETANLPIYSCNLETGEIETEEITIQVPVNSSVYLELLFENFQPLIAATCPEVINLTSTFIPATGSFYEETDPDIEYVKLEIIELPIDRKTIQAGQTKDYTYFSGWFSWLKNGIKANQEESINKSEQIFFKPKDCNGFRYYCLYSATVACTIYKKA